MAKKHRQGLSTRDKQCSKGICTKDAIAWDEVTKEGYYKTHQPQLDKLKATSTALLVSIRSALQANWQKPLFGSQCKSNELSTRLE